MKIVQWLWILLLPGSAFGANWYVRQSGGAGTGTSWNAAWNGGGAINWASVQPGDTVWFAGGSTAYPTFNVGKSGTSGNPVTVKRATALDAACTSSAGWSSSFDAVVLFTGSIGVYAKNYVTIDGNINADQPYGIKLDRSSTAWTGDRYRGVSSFGGGVPTTNLSFYRIEVQGRGYSAGTDPNCSTFDGFSIGGGAYNNAFNPPQYNALISHCYSHDDDTLMRVNNFVNGVVEYCLLQNAISGNPCDHPDSIYVYPCNNLIIRYCLIPNAISESVFMDYGSLGDVWVYGNVFYTVPGFNGAWGGAANQLITFKQGYTWGRVHVLNNTFQSPVNALAIRAEEVPATSELYNNAFMGCSISSTPALRSNNLTVSSSAFINSSGSDYRPAVGSPLINAGKTLTSDGYINKDMNGNTRGADGAWDVGAYEFVSGSGTAPVITTQPVAQSCLVGQTLGPFTVTATGTNPLKYQWYTGAAIPGATNTSFSIPNATLTDSTNYHCVVMNAYWTAFSATVPGTVSSVVPPPDGITVGSLSVQGAVRVQSLVIRTN